MTLALIVWLVMTALPALTAVGISLMVLAVIGLFVGGVTAIDYGSNNCVLRFVRWHLRWAIPVMLVSVFVPSKETAWYMIGAYAGQTLVQSETGQALASDSVDVLKSLVRKSKDYIDNIDTGKPAEKPVLTIKGDKS